MDKKVAIVGFRMKCAPDLVTTRERLTFELTRGLFDDLGIDRTAVDTTIFSTNDFLDGRTISNVFLDAPAGAYMRDESKVEMDGLNAVMYAVMRILSGQYRTAMVVALGLTGSQVSPYLHVEYQLSPIYDRQMKLLNEINAAAFQARSYLARYGYSDELLHEAAAQALSNAAANPFQARRLPGVSKEQVASSPPYYEPLRELHCYPPTDGGCAVLLASEERARELTEKPVWILGMGQSIETFYIGERDLSRSPSTSQAAKRAYDMAGIKDPKAEVDLAEVSALFAHQEPLLAEALGLLEEGTAEEAYKSGDTSIAGKMPVNPSGGALGAHPVSATGLIRLAEAVRQLRGEAGENQVGKAEVAVVHGQDGPCAQQNAVLLLGV
ncbi:thiolase family protein [Candidatus Solincola tengchongensis]|uniref:thiolase family protein n=1 Tax=Candidatus Solincola tengchongensis TaxID=2900693 RepID=UPI00257BB9BB|nr:thiolase family protein [Candidatus Solincola tengchongensis]